VEGWHIGFESTLAQVHHHIFKLIEAIHREQVLVEANTEQVIAGNPLAKKKKVYKNSAARLQELVKRYPGNTRAILMRIILATVMPMMTIIVATVIVSLHI